MVYLERKMIEEVQRLCTTNQENLIYIVFFLLYVVTINGSTNCSWSTRNMEKVSYCPLTVKENNEAAFIKNCEALSFMQTCSIPSTFKYHCVASEKENVFMEVCAPEVEIQHGYCATFNPQTGLLESLSSKQCVNTTDPCPERYASSDSYLYPFCYGFDDINIIKEKTAASSLDDYDFSHPITLGLVSFSSAISLIVGIVCTLRFKKLKIWCSTKWEERTKRQGQSTESESGSESEILRLGLCHIVQNEEGEGMEHHGQPSAEQYNVTEEGEEIENNI